MAKRIQKPPSVADNKDFRARETFENDIENMCKRVGTTTSDVGSIAAGGVGTVTITVPDALADVGQTVQIGLPSALSSALVPHGTITADGVVTIRLYNPTGSPIDPASGVYSARVMP